MDYLRELAKRKDKDSRIRLNKKTQKTPPREIEQARRELADLKERGLDNEQ